MKVTLNEEEIKDAIKAHIANQGFVASNKNVEIDLVAGRGANGHTATIEISASKTEKVAKKSSSKKEVIKDPEVTAAEQEEADNAEETIEAEDTEKSLFGN